MGKPKDKEEKLKLLYRTHENLLIIENLPVLISKDKPRTYKEYLNVIQKKVTIEGEKAGYQGSRSS